MEQKYSLRVKIRKIKCKDYHKDCLNLLSQHYDINPSLFDYYIFKKYIKQQRKNNYHIFVAEYKNIIVGMITCFIETKLIHNFGKVAHIEDLIVRDNYRGYSVGTNLVKTCIHHAYVNNCYKIILDCEDKNVKFYEKLKFTRNGSYMTHYF
jgi:glucosamine-phosphate N-acetyltransferase